jgi:fructosamine-3-kinase
MTLPQARLREVLGNEITRADAVGGRSTAPVWRVRLASGEDAIVKHGSGVGLEGWMLDYLGRVASTPVPRVRHVEETLLVLDFVDGCPGVATERAEESLARIVAALHAHEDLRYGFLRETVIGGLPQPNPESTSWIDFFREQRLLYMAREGLQAGRLPMTAMTRIERLASRLERWLPSGGRPSLVHGDLWHGNVLSHGDRVVALIDPAIYFADPEIELAFMTLFGSVGERFFAAYSALRPIAPGFFEERRELYNLYPLLVHVRLFGGSYVAQVETTLARFGC